VENSLQGFNGMIFMKIDHSVGKGGSNRHDDVQRIQFMLNTAHLDPANNFRMPVLLAMDGICGPKTKSGILDYQTVKKTSMWPLLTADGLVSAHSPAAYFGRTSLGFSTLYNLNWDFIQAMERADFMYMAAYMSVEPLYSLVVLPLRKAGAIP
jgi:hypothetical protein